jgi:hypothetical protein
MSAMPRFLHLLTAGSLSILGAGCALPMENEDKSIETEADLGTSQESISNGFASTEQYSGVVALQYWSTTLNTWYTFCSATLVTNKVAVTAEHCLTNPIVLQKQLWGRMGTQFIPISATRTNSDFDIAVVRFSYPMYMYAWNAFMPLPSSLAGLAVNDHDYGRAFYSGTNASLDWTYALCAGYGGGGTSLPQPPLRSAFLRVRYRDTYQPFDELHAYRTNNQLQQPGDSGGPCLNIGSGQPFTSGTPIYIFTAPLEYVQSRCAGGSFDFCYGYGAESWGPWAFLTVADLNQ